jgi:hypothetical protein
VLWGRIPRGNGGRVAAVLLVDNAAQPMQAAPVAALKGIAVSGNASKLHVIFTHFDKVKGDNLPGFSDCEQHVLASLENVLQSIGDELGPVAERVLRRTDRPGALLRRRYPGSARRQEEGRLVFDPAARRGP